MVRGAEASLLNTATMVDTPRKAKQEVRPFDEDEVYRFLASVEGDRYEALYLTALATGLRQGELLGLRWQAWRVERGL